MTLTPPTYYHFYKLITYSYLMMFFPFSYRKTVFFIVTWQHWCYLSSLYWLSTADLLAILFFSWLFVYLQLHGFFWNTLHCMKKYGMLHVDFFYPIFQALKIVKNISILIWFNEPRIKTWPLYIIILTSKYLALSIISHLFYLGWLMIESMNR